MIDTNYARTMARYNRWQNRSLYREADGLADTDRRATRGIFFGSLHNTLAHIIWADRMWMARLDGWDFPEFGPADGETVFDWETLKSTRAGLDEDLIAWAERLGDGDLAGDLSWHSAILNTDVSKPKWLLVTHLFNHQTHHRGQAHGVLTGFGMKPDATDLGFMPDDV